MDSSLRKLLPWFTVMGLLVGALIVAAFYKDQFREWKIWQRVHIKQELARAVSDAQREAALRIPVEIRQIVLPDLRRVDRCITCHLTVEDPSYAGFKQPLAYHPDHAQHPIEKFGCTICHQGQGRATTREAAHGHVEHWEQPMLAMQYIESACAKCHLPSDVPNAPKLARGRVLFDDLGCIGCHKLQGVGGVIGPELDGVGARHGAEWLGKHFRNPAAITSGSAMPPIKVGEQDIEALTLYMLSFTGERLSDYYVSMKTIPGADAGRRLFTEKGCMACHSLAGVGGKIGPALDEVAKRRDTKWIIEHFRNPQAVNPGSIMPRFDLTEQEMRALTEFLLTKTDPNIVGFLRIPALMTPIQRGQAVFKKYGCAGCHGAGGMGGVPNPNAKTAQQVPSLKFVADSYTKDELKKRVLNGQREIPSLNPKGPPPPLYMPPWRGRIAEGELGDLVVYLMSLMPKEEKVTF
ncbi:MAG: c-type cytochrome [Verrucomicrobia bacterium]|nr:c-type cytochrome [Verrucomicrobiota bacterium]